MSVLFLEAIISITHTFFPEHHLFCFVEEFWFVFHCLKQLGYSVPIHFVACTVLTDLEAAAAPTEGTTEINPSLL